MKTGPRDEPNADDLRYYCTDLPMIIYNMITEVLHVAKSISDDLKNKVYKIVGEEMEHFAKNFVDEMTRYKNKVEHKLSVDRIYKIVPCLN